MASGKRPREREAERVQIGSRARVSAAPELRRHVQRRAAERRRNEPGSRIAARSIGGGQAEVDELEPTTAPAAALGHEQVRRLDVAVQQPHLVRRGETARRFEQQFEHPLVTQPPTLRGDVGLQRFSFQELHRQAGAPLDLVRRVNLDDVRVRELRQHASLALELPHQLDVACKLRPQELEQLPASEALVVSPRNEPDAPLLGQHLEAHVRPERHQRRRPRRELDARHDTARDERCRIRERREGQRRIERRRARLLDRRDGAQRAPGTPRVRGTAVGDFRRGGRGIRLVVVPAHAAR